MLYDLIVVGAGPSGITAGIFARTRKLKTLIIEAAQAGGQLAALYPDKEVMNWPGHVNTDAGQLSKSLVNHARTMGCEFREQERANALDDRDGHLVVRTDKGEYEALAIILATGMGLFTPRRLGITGEERLEGKGVYYRLPEREYLKGKEIIFVGGGNSALEMALLACQSAETCIVHRREAFRADEAVVERVHNSEIETIMSAQVVEIKGKDRVEGVVLEHDGTRTERRADAVVINIGTASVAEDMRRWGVDTENGLIKVDNRHAYLPSWRVRLR